MKIATTLLTLAGVCLAHFDIDSPAPRDGTEDLTELIPPCGGLPLGNRTVITPVDGIFHITGALEHPTAQANFSLYVGNDDPSQVQFATYFDGGYNTTLHLGDFDFKANVADIPAVVDGVNAVIQVAMFTPDGHLTACSDITFSFSASTAETSTSEAVASTSGNPYAAPSNVYSGAGAVATGIFAVAASLIFV
ncbi:hypothetical protein HK100_002044 [Physocladia obscura]|uniref:Copper acquisition factor BIM1-like domain-containing protein n=1 Tax=Physocladia obscura TaxID=109957 RepID=A0AAD5SVX6_9FUNG|nr:hypothetical protein HK100_002044 [Physocladia obscura]